MRRKRFLTGFTIIEFLLVICLILTLIGSFAVYVNITLNAARKIALQNELINIRMAIEYYRIVNARFPAELSELYKKNVLTLENLTGIILPKQFLQEVRLDKEGYLLDPFMNRYNYNANEGTVYSKTKWHEE